MKARRTTLSLFYEGTDISKDISGSLLSFSFTDNESGKADDITVKIKDTDGLWSGAWFPGKGDTIQATIIDHHDTIVQSLYCGRFQIDGLTSSGPPATFDIKAVSVPLGDDIRREARSRGWEDVKLSKIVNDIAARGSLEALYDVTRDHQYDRLDQRNESDLKFLQRVCRDEGYSLKVTDNQLVVFEQAKYEAMAPVGAIERGASNVLGWSFDSQAHDLYSDCTCGYYDPTTETLLERTVKDPRIVDGMSKRIVKRSASLSEAERLAKAELRSLNRHEVKANIKLRGSVQWIAGVTVTVTGWGVYDGKYIVEEATHDVGAGYTTGVKLRRTLEGY